MKWRYTNIQHEPRTKLGLNPAEYCVLDIIYQSQTHPRYSFDGWARIGCHKIASFLGLSSGTVHKMFERFEAWSLLEFDETREYKRTTPAWYDIAYIEDTESEASVQILNSVQKVNRGCSKSEQETVQKVNGKRSKSEPKTNKPNIETKEVKESALTFDAFWDLYDKKRSRVKCEKKWKKISEDDRARIFEHVPLYKKSEPIKQFRKDPLTYLNGECWNDEIIPRQQKTNNNAKDEPRFGAATHAEIERALEIRRARRQAV